MHIVRLLHHKTKNKFILYTPDGRNEEDSKQIFIVSLPETIKIEHVVQITQK